MRPVCRVDGPVIGGLNRSRPDLPRYDYIINNVRDGSWLYAYAGLKLSSIWIGLNLKKNNNVIATPRFSKLIDVITLSTDRFSTARDDQIRNNKIFRFDRCGVLWKSRLNTIL